MTYSSLIRGQLVFVTFSILLAAAFMGGSFVFGGEIHEAATKGDLEKVKMLLKSNTELAVSKDKDGDPPLYLAAEKDRKEVVQFLLTYKVDVNVTNSMGRTPLHGAVQQDFEDVAELLLANKSDVNARDILGATPLHFG